MLSFLPWAFRPLSTEKSDSWMVIHHFSFFHSFAACAQHINRVSNEREGPNNYFCFDTNGHTTRSPIFIVTLYMYQVQLNPSQCTYHLLT